MERQPAVYSLASAQHPPDRREGKARALLQFVFPCVQSITLRTRLKLYFCLKIDLKEVAVQGLGRDSMQGPSVMWAVFAPHTWAESEGGGARYREARARRVDRRDSCWGGRLVSIVSRPTRENVAGGAQEFSIRRNDESGRNTRWRSCTTVNVHCHQVVS